MFSESGDTPALVQEALLNGAKAHETLGDTDSARRLYEQLARTYPGSSDGKQAAEQLKRLDEEAGVVDLLKRELADSGGRAPVPPPPPPPQP